MKGGGNSYLTRPRGKGWSFQMATPQILKGRVFPRTGKPFPDRWIRIGLGTTDVLQARRERDLIVAAIRAEEIRAEQDFGALAVAAEMAALPSGSEARQEARVAAWEVAEGIEKRKGTKAAKRWYGTATGKATPLKEVYPLYVLWTEERGELSQSSRNNLATAYARLLEFASQDVTLQEVTRLQVSEFVNVFLRDYKSPKAPDGLRFATLTRYVTLLTGLWKWAKRQGYLPHDYVSPWEGQAPSKKATRKEAEESGKHRRPYTPEEVEALMEGIPEGTALGDIFRVGLMTGVRLEEVADLYKHQIVGHAEGYEIMRGKTQNAARFIPLVGLAQAVIRRRAEAAEEGGALFPELKVRESTKKRGGAISQKFTRERRKILGAETDDELCLHALRHTWRTQAEQAMVPDRPARKMGGWKDERSNDSPYAHGMTREQYRVFQQKIAERFYELGHLPVPVTAENEAA